MNGARRPVPAVTTRPSEGWRGGQEVLHRPLEDLEPVLGRARVADPLEMAGFRLDLDKYTVYKSPALILL
jgi:hypothetical protein